MKTKLLVWSCLFAGIVANAPAQDKGKQISAAALASELSAAAETSAYIRMRMDIKSSSGDPKGALQLQIKQRADGNSRVLVYQVLWPKERKGEAVLLKRRGGSLSGAYRSADGEAKTLSAGDMGERLFGSDLTYQDVIENVYTWDQQALVGEEMVNKVNCLILESKPSARSLYSSVKSWVDPRRNIPMKIEKYGSGGAVLCRIDVTRVVTDDRRRAVPANLMVQRPGSGTITEIDGSKIRHDVSFSDHDFTPEGLSNLKAPVSGD